MRTRVVLPLIYCAIAAVAWIDFVRAPPDGLANVGLMLVALPITLIDFSLGRILGVHEALFIPSGFGYYIAHAVFFGASVAIIASILYLIGRWIDRRCKRKPQTLP